MKLSRLWKGIKFGQIGVASLVLNAVNRDLGRRYLIRELSRMPGVPSKMGQLLSMRFGKTEWQEFTPEPVPIGWIKHRIETESPALAAIIDEISPTGVLASLGQVHHALLKDGQEVAIKVRYPQVDEQMDEQLDLMFAAFQGAPKGIRRSIDMAAYESFLKEFFHEELDYLNEAKSQDRFRTAWLKSSGGPKIVIPSVYPEWSTKSILVQSYEPSIGLHQIWELSQVQRSDCATLLSKFFMSGVFETGLIHADLHPKNWGFRPETGELVVYDFGGTLVLSQEMVQVLRSLASGKLRSINDYVLAYSKLGFDTQKLAAICDRLPELTSVLFEPVRVPGPFKPGDWKIQERIEALLSHEKWNFRSAGPPWFLMLMRSFNGWLYGLQQLRADIGLRNLVDFEVFEDGREFKVPEPGSAVSGVGLYIRVMEGDQEVVALDFPARSVEMIEELIPENVLQSLIRSQIDLSEIKKRAIDSGLAPQLLFEHERGNRRYRVWLQ